MSQIAGIFPIGDTGESFGIAYWEPDPDLIAQELFKLANDTENWAIPLAETRAALIEDTRLHFETQYDPYGEHWTLLDEDYANRKEREGFDPNAILIRTGALESAATSEDAWLIEEHSIMFNSGVLPPYGMYHQTGTIDDLAQRALAKARRNSIAKAAGKQLEAFTPQEAAAFTTLTGSGRNLPQRMFIGADVATIDEIEAIFIKWLDAQIAKDWESIPPPSVSVGSNILGTFPIMGYTTRGVPILRTPSGPRFGRKV